MYDRNEFSIQLGFLRPAGLRFGIDKCQVWGVYVNFDVNNVGSPNVCSLCWDHSKGLRSSLWLFSMIYRTQLSNPKCIGPNRHLTNVDHNGFHIFAFIKNINGALPKRRPKAFALVPEKVHGKFAFDFCHL